MTRTAEPTRKVVHVDADAFYASVEIRDHPHLRGQPVAVAHHGPRSVVTTASYEARRFGVKSALPLRTALARCPGLIVVEPRMDRYREASRLIQAVFREYTDLVEPLSLDEAYLDLTHPRQGPASATLIAQDIRRLVHERTGGLTVSCGVSFNKALAKIGSGMNKPDGLTVILPKHAEELIARLPVGDLYGVGPKTAERLAQMGVHTGAHLRQQPLSTLLREFGKYGQQMFDIARAVDHRPVDPSDDRKSIGSETTFDTDLHDPQEMLVALEQVAQRTSVRLARHALAGTVVVLKIKYDDFQTVTRRVSLPAPVRAVPELHRVAAHLLEQGLAENRGVRLLGISVTDLLDPDGRDVPPQLFNVV